MIKDAMCRIKSRWLVGLAGAMLIVLGAGGCGDDNDDGGTGTLSMQGAMAASMKSTTHDCAMQDFRILIRKMWVTTDDVVEGEEDNLNWVEIYTADATEAWADRQFDIDLPVGNYVAYKFLWKNEFEYVCLSEGQTYDLPNLMNSSLAPDADTTGINTPHGSYQLDQNNLFVLTSQGEVVSPFEIHAGQVTNMTWRWNVVSFDWIDTDDSSDFSEGDEIDNGQIPAGIEGDSMWDFLIEYE